MLFRPGRGHPCRRQRRGYLVFHPDKNYKEKTYFLKDKKHDDKNFEQAMKRAQEFDYLIPTKKTKIPLGIFYREKRKAFEENIK